MEVVGGLMVIKSGDFSFCIFVNVEEVGVDRGGVHRTRGGSTHTRSEQAHIKMIIQM